MIALSSFLCGLQYCQRQLYDLILRKKKQIVPERSARWDLWHFGLYCGVVRSHPQFHQHVDVIFGLGYEVTNCLGSFEFKTTLVVMMMWMIVTKALEELMLKLTSILSSLSLEPIAAGMPQTFRASTRILPTGRLENHYWAAHQQQLDPDYRNVREIEGGNWTRTPLVRTSGHHTYDKWHVFGLICIRMYATSSVFMTCPARKTFFSCLHNSSMHCNIWVTLSFNQWRFYL